MRLLALLALTGCVTEQVAVTPRELLHHVAEFRDHGHAVVDVRPSGTRDLAADRAFDVTLDGKPARLTIRDMIASCPDSVPVVRVGRSRCLLLDTKVEELPLETHRRVDWDDVKLFGGAFVVLLVIGVVVAPFEYLCAQKGSSCSS